MTTTTTITSTECEVADQIIPWSEVKPKDLVLWDGELSPVERIYPMDHGNPAVVIEGEAPGGCIPIGTHAAVRRYVQTDPVDDFQVHADEEGDLRLLCPRAEDLGCLFAAEVLSGSTIAEITEKARSHAGEEAESAHDFIRTINGEPGTPPAQEAWCGAPGACTNGPGPHPASIRTCRVREPELGPAAGEGPASG